MANSRTGGVAMRASASGKIGRNITLGVVVGLCVAIPQALGGFIYALSLAVIVVVFACAAARVIAAIRPFSSVPVIFDNSYRPKVSVLVTSKDEPASVVISCVESLSRLDYPNYEVIVINSNSTDVQNYAQIARYIQSLPSNFRFVHLDKVHGFKAGALNYLNHRCVSDDSVVEAVVDCDYIVDPDFLRRTVGYFKDARVGLVQAPQDYSRVGTRNAGLYYEYRSFFSTVMHQAQRLGLVSFTGTMGLVRTSLVRRESGWDEDCITEDAAAGARINREGYLGVYVDESLGKGYMPFDYANLIRQRRRWVYGNMQVLSQDLGKIVRDKKLRIAQKLAFLTQVTAWFQPELVVSALSGIFLLLWRLSGGQVFGIAGVAMLNLLGVCFITSIITYIVGLRREASITERLQALLVHYGLLSVMSTGWLLWLSGYRMGFAVTKKTPDTHAQASVPAAQFVIVCLLALNIVLMPHSVSFMWGTISAIATLVLSIVSVPYANQMFSEGPAVAVEDVIKGSSSAVEAQQRGDLR
jgi:cellulose synthase/poly-beta-1,6-N-acetylglucosamine synthase-like glycosyltransferase